MNKNGICAYIELLGKYVLYVRTVYNYLYLLN